MNEELYHRRSGYYTRWTSFENPSGGKGSGALENGGAKGRAFDGVEPGEEKTLLDVNGSGTINRIWMTVSEMKKAPSLLRSLTIEMFWDGESKPAVSVPLPDFFCMPLGRPASFESVLFSSPEGKSFNSFVKMPFIKAARIILRNDSQTRIKNFFYDINYTLMPHDKDKTFYFHAFWNRENTSKITADYTILPKLSGAGCFIGVNMGVRLNKEYADSWFGEGEIKFYLDGDGKSPTLCGTGTEDYIGTGWGQGLFSNMTQGCLLADKDKYMYGFYRQHTGDPIYFYEDIRAEIQCICGQEKYGLLRTIDRGARVKIVSCDDGKEFGRLFNEDFILERGSKDGWYNFYAEMDYTSTAYFYYSSPSSCLPPLAPLSYRTADLD